MTRPQRKKSGESESGAHRRAADAPETAVPSWLPAALYGLVTLVLFRKFVIADVMLFGSDTLGLGYAARSFYAEAIRSGTFPLWNPRILGGTPFVESLAGGDSLYPTSLLLLFQETHRALGWKLVIHVFAAGLFMYGWARTLGVSKPSSLVAGLAYLMAPFMVTLVWPGHDGKIFIAALTPLVFLLAERTLAKPDWGRYAALALGIGLVLLTTHFQASYFLFGAVGFYYTFRCAQLWRERGARTLLSYGLFLAAAAAGASVAAIQLLPAVDYVTEHSRRAQTTTEASPEEAREYSSSWGLHPEEVGSLVVPEFVGSNVGSAGWASDTYWGRNVFKHNHEYAGLVVLILASLAFVGGRLAGTRWFFVGLGALALLFGLGQHTPVWGVIYEVVPGVSLFRAPSIAAFLFGFAAITLMALGLDRAIALARAEEPDWKRAQRVLFGWMGALAALGALALTGLLFQLWNGVLYDDIEPNKLAALDAARPFIVRGFIFSTLLAAGVWGALKGLRVGRLGAAAAVGVIGVLAVADVLRVDDPFIQPFDFRSWAAPDANVRFLQERLREEDPFRVFSMVGGGGQDVKLSMYGLELAAGHHPNDLGRYRDLIGMAGSGIPQRFFTSANVLRLLNVRYIVWPVAQIGALEGVEGIPQLEGLTRVSEVALPSGQVLNAVYAFPGLARARLVADAIVVPNEEANSALDDPSFDPATQVVLTTSPPLILDGATPTGSVSWTSRDPNRMSLEVSTERAALLVLAETWYPAWRATVDGQSTSLIRANYAQRAVPLTPGNHTVELAYDAGFLRTPLLLSLGATVLLLSVLVGGGLRARRPRTPEVSSPPE